MPMDAPPSRVYFPVAEPLPGALLLRPPVFRDARGDFVKTMSPAFVAEVGFTEPWVETFLTVSRRGVLRGMHAQLPPCAHAKLVHCIRGRVLDVIIDLRRDHPTYGRHAMLELSDQDPLLLYLPVGYAHGFLALEDNSTLLYQISSAHSPAHDVVIRWDSFGFTWPISAPVVSERDARGIKFDDFESPFA